MLTAKRSIKGKFVSLFTREWIEITSGNFGAVVVAASPSLRGSGLKFVSAARHPTVLVSPSLRGSGLKYNLRRGKKGERNVSLFTREWIEISNGVRICWTRQSPSLRGSGLKFLQIRRLTKP